MTTLPVRLVIEGATFENVEAFLMLLDDWMGVPPSSSGEVTIRCDREDMCAVRVVIDALPERLDDFVSASVEAFDVLRPGGLAAVDVAPDASYWRSTAAALERLARGSLTLHDERGPVDLQRHLSETIAAADCTPPVRRRLRAAVRQLTRPAGLVGGGR